MKRVTILGLVLSGLMLLLGAETAQAQYRYGRGYGGYGGYSGYGGYYSPGYRSYGWPSYGYGSYAQPYNTWSYSSPRYYSGYPTYYTPRYSSGYTPYYGTTYYSGPTYYPGTTYYSGPTDMSRAQAPASGSYQSFYAGPPAADRARLHIVLPTADAQLWVENEATQQRGNDRWFDSPPVQAGKDYMYTLRARWMQNGREVTAKKDVTFRAGQQTTVTFANADVEQTP
jgi:uncharacterized protein (TIGR03000 family)